VPGTSGESKPDIDFVLQENCQWQTGMKLKRLFPDRSAREQISGPSTGKQQFRFCTGLIVTSRAKRPM
jgi:hypothetical protein